MVVGSAVQHRELSTVLGDDLERRMAAGVAGRLKRVGIYVYL